ncbi:MAG: ABC transporter substrate-binding protein [Verrucomicrobiota bacterium]
MNAILPNTLISLICAATLALAGPNQTPLKYAKNFTIEDHGSHTVIRVSNTWRGSGDTLFTYALVPREQTQIPKLPENAILFRTPIERVVTFSTVYFGHFQALDLHHTLIGAANVEFTNDPKVLQSVESGKTKSIESGSALNIETILLLQPELLLTSSTGSPQFDTHPKLLRAKQPLAITAGYMENHPLARSEWIKFVAAFFHKEEQASEIFDQIASRYETLAALTKNIKDRPTILANAPYAGKWHVPGGQSYSAQAFKDAGGDYLWADDQTSGGVPLDFETVYLNASDADYWINPGRHRSIKELLDTDTRFQKFEALQKNRVFNNTRRINANGGNDIWERGILHPEEVLADLISILHPTLLPNHTPIFYEQLH